MLKNIIIKIKVIDEFGELYNFFGEFKKEDIDMLVKIATKENMACLSFIDLPRDTYFNVPQCNEIKKELIILGNYKELDSKLLEAIKKAVNLAIKEPSLVKFEVVEKF